MAGLMGFIENVRSYPLSFLIVTQVFVIMERCVMNDYMEHKFYAV